MSDDQKRLRDIVEFDGTTMKFIYGTPIDSMQIPHVTILSSRIAQLEKALACAEVALRDSDYLEVSREALAKIAEIKGAEAPKGEKE